MTLARDEGWLVQFAAARAYPYQEFTRAAFRAGLHELRDRGVTTARVQCGAANQKELVLFAAEGFEPDETLPRLRYTRSARGRWRPL
jgi:hypothetical protein